VVELNRAWYHRRRQALQSVGTKSAKKRLKQLAGRQARFQRDCNHRISKELISEAKRTHRGIVLEDLHGIRSRTRVSRANRDRHNNWSFFQLRFFVEYKSRAAGVLLILVNPRYTSQRCNQCGCVDPRNRRSQSVFSCVDCGYETHADYNASQNIRDLGFKGYGQQPHGSDLRVSYKPLASARGS
jgi:IS605 OrfB family transposase